ncbi:MAG: AMP-binding protein [Burkholderiales bacterium]|nr:AMP-binding protein [Burkholderiales bacterium]
MLLGTLLRESARRAPLAEAIVDEGRRWTYRQWNAEVNRVAHGLLDLGIGVGDRVACSLTNRIEFLTVMFATQKIGALAVPLNYRLTPAELDVIGADCLPKAWCFEAHTAPALAETALMREKDIAWIACDGAGCVDATAYGDLLAGSDGEPAEPMIDSGAASLIMYTSGTTGRPKGVVLSHQAQYLNSALMLAELGLAAGDRTLHIAPLYHVAAYHVIALPLVMAGGANVLVRRYEPETVASWIEREGITTVLGAPTHFELWAAHGRIPAGAAPGRLRSAYITGAPARADNVAWIRERLTPGLWNVYGQTEASSLITLLPPAEMHRMGALNCIGRNLMGMETRIVAPGSGYAAADSEPDIGELVSRGDKMMTEYYRAPDKTAAKLRSGWLHTGDLVQRDADGYYYLVGRVDDLIITGGENVYPLEIEQVLAEAPEVADCAVVGVPDPVWGQIIAAFVVPRGECDLRALARYAEGRLATHKRPRRWTTIDAVPRNPSGKVLLRELRTRAGDLRELSEIRS